MDRVQEMRAMRRGQQVRNCKAVSDFESGKSKPIYTGLIGTHLCAMLHSVAVHSVLMTRFKTVDVF